MVGDLPEIAKRLVADFGDSLLIVLVGSSTLIAALFALCWFLTQRHFNRAGHQVPGGVVKNYLDSVIQNSMALRSALFREGGLEASSVRSIYKLDKEASSTAASDSGSQAAEVTTLKQQLAQKDQAIGDLQNQLRDSMSEAIGSSQQKEQVGQLNEEITQLKKSLAQAEVVKKERDDLKQQLRQQAPAQAPPSAPSTPSPASTSSAEAVQVAGAPIEPEFSQEAREAIVAGQNPDQPPKKSNEKTAEELLDEFEKMLG